MTRASLDPPAVGASADIDGMDAAKVATSPRRPPPSAATRKASSNIASFGLSVGRPTASPAASMAGPKAEQVNRMPLQPVRLLYSARSMKRCVMAGVSAPASALSTDRLSSSRFISRACGQCRPKAAWTGCTASAVAWIKAMRGDGAFTAAFKDGQPQPACFAISFGKGKSFSCLPFSTSSCSAC